MSSATHSSVRPARSLSTRYDSKLWELTKIRLQQSGGVSRLHDQVALENQCRRRGPPSSCRLLAGGAPWHRLRLLHCFEYLPGAPAFGSSSQPQNARYEHHELEV